MSASTPLTSKQTPMSEPNLIIKTSAITDPNKHSHIHTLIVAAGRGQRFGGEVAKQYTQVAGQTVLQHSVAQLAKSRFVTEIMIVIAADDKYIHELNFNVPIKLTYGGAERWQSVKAGVEAIAQSGANTDDLVLIHDAARPCINSDYVDDVVNVAKLEPYGAILGTPVTDTLKQVQSTNTMSTSKADNSNDLAKIRSDKTESDKIQANKGIRQIVKTVDRQLLWQAQTPQVFRLGKLLEVLEYVNTNQLPITDEASAFEALGYPIKIVKGDRLNMKLTYPSEIQLIKAILNFI